MIEEIVIGEDKVIRFSGVEKGEACSVILRGASQQILDEAERSLHDALCVLVQTTQVRLSLDHNPQQLITEQISHFQLDLIANACLYSSFFSFLI